MSSKMSSKMSSIDLITKRVIRVKRKANEDKAIANKRCKYIGSCDSSDDKDIYQLLISSQTLPQSGTEDSINKLKISDYEEMVANDKDFDPKPNERTEVITCNGQPLEAVENRLSESFESYIYDIYIYENEEILERLQSDDSESDDEEITSNDENYLYNDYPDENEVSDEAFDYYSYRDRDHEEDDGVRAMRRQFARNTVSSDYDLSEEESEKMIDKYYRKDSSGCSSSEEFGDEEDN